METEPKNILQFHVLLTKNALSMSKHLSNFKTLKLLNDKYAMKFN